MKHIYTILVVLAVAMGARAQHGEYVGGDVSLLPAYEAHNEAYLDGNGQPIDDLLVWLTKECGWNTFRVRLFVKPTNAGHDGVIQDLDYVKEFGKRIKDAGAKFALDIHYSDTWADPVTQTPPASWSAYSTVDAKAEKVYSYTKETLEALAAYGATPDLVQVGNEITSGIVGVWRSTDQAGFKKIVERGCDAVREACPAAKIILHVERPQNTNTIVGFFQDIDASKFDVMGLSYYPFWHSTLSALGTTIKRLGEVFPAKKVQIVETAYNFQYEFSKPTTESACIWGRTADGQYGFVKALIAELAKYENCNGLMYWFPEEAGCGDDTDWDHQSYGNVITSWINRGLWWPTSNGGHWPVKAEEGMVHYLLKTFLSDEASGVSAAAATTQSDAIYNLAGQRVTTPKANALYIMGGKKFVSK
ncbi:MAG: glycosyl hydrolase 53 family protein [Bacteroidaceae bacterium]|nr:glycosyl hydrolase 53 family protein [Bacteroidaceae bacterium]